MKYLRPPAWLALASALLAAPASAQPDKASAASTYRSAFESYKRFGDEPLLPWPQANDTVGRIGGWKAYAREAQGAASSPATAKPAHPHSHHKSP